MKYLHQLQSDSSHRLKPLNPPLALKAIGKDEKLLMDLRVGRQHRGRLASCSLTLGLEVLFVLSGVEQPRSFHRHRMTDVGVSAKTSLRILGVFGPPHSEKSEACLLSRKFIL